MCLFTLKHTRKHPIVQKKNNPWECQFIFGCSHLLQTPIIGLALWHLYPLFSSEYSMMQRFPLPVKTNTEKMNPLYNS